MNKITISHRHFLDKPQSTQFSSRPSSKHSEFRAIGQSPPKSARTEKQYYKQKLLTKSNFMLLMKIKNIKSSISNKSKKVTISHGKGFLKLKEKTIKTENKRLKQKIVSTMKRESKEHMRRSISQYLKRKESIRKHKYLQQ